MRDQQDVAPVMYDSYGDEIYPGETIYHVEVMGKMKIMCPGCFKDWVMNDLTPDEIAEAFGIRTEVA